MKKIARRRIAIGMTVSEFCRRVGISRKAYYDWEKRAAPLAPKYAQLVSGVLGIAIDDLSEEANGQMTDTHAAVRRFDIHEVKGRTRWAIDHIITAHALSNAKLAKILGLSTSTVDSYRRGIKTPKFETLAFMQTTYRISLDWMVDGLGSQFTDIRAAELFSAPPAKCAGPDAGNDDAALPPGEFVFIPQMAGTTSRGGLAPDAATEMRIAFRRDWIARKGLPQDMSIIKVQGDSMEPTLQSGDLVLVHHSKDTITRGGLFAITIDQEILIKRIQPLMGQKLLVISDNSKYTSLEIAAEEIHINGKVIWFARELER